MTRPTRAKFRSDASRRALAMDPGGSGVIADVLRGVQPQPGAFGWFDVPEPCGFDAEAVVDGVAVLTISGPLEHHRTWIWQSYEALTASLREALADASVKAVVLKIDSPGGVAAGMGECHKAIRKAREESGKPLYAYADQMACSAAYNVASACDEIWTSEEGVVGSIGVILCAWDETKMLDKAGIKVRYLVTGKRKADMHYGAPLTDDVIDEAQSKVDYLGALFFNAVGRARRMKPEAVEALQAAVFHGPDAVKAGLADGVAGWDDFFSYVKDSVRATNEAPRATPTGAAKGKATMRTKLQLTKALADACALTDEAKKARDKSPDDQAALAKYIGAAHLVKDAANAVAKADPSMVAKMKKVTEKYSEKRERLEETDDDGEEEAEDSMPESTEKSAPASGDEEAAAAEEEEAEGDAEQEKAIARGWVAAQKAYAAATKGIDAYGVFGPQKMLKALEKATGESDARGMLGALAAQPKRRASEERIEKDLAALKADATRAKVDAIVERAKAEGRATTKKFRAELRELGIKMGPKYLQGFVAELPKQIRTTEDGARTHGESEERDVAATTSAADAEAEKILATLLAGEDEKKKEAMRATFNKQMKANGAARVPKM